VKVFVQVDLPKQRAQRHVLNPDGTFELLAERPATARNRDFGSMQVLKDFLIVGKRLRDAEFTLVVLNGHGTSIIDLERFAGSGQRSARQQKVWPAFDQHPDGWRSKLLARCVVDSGASQNPVADHHAQQPRLPR